MKTDFRNIFVDTLAEYSKIDDRNAVITMDVGFSYLDKLKGKCRVENFGITEMSSMITAAALSRCGWNVWVYSMIPFVTFRPFEAVRNAVVMHHSNVKLVGVSGSEKYSFLGFSHCEIIEDEAAKHLALLPGMEISIPKTEAAAREAVLKAYHSKNPFYLRL